jgi:hypothetical protein
MRKPEAVYAIVILWALLTGCEIVDVRKPLGNAIDSWGADSTPEPTDAIRKNDYPHWPKPIQQAVDRREVQIGMDKLQVQLALRLSEGRLEKKTLNTPRGVIEKWMAWRTNNGWSPVKLEMSRLFVFQFMDGKVVEIYH